MLLSFLCALSSALASVPVTVQVNDTDGKPVPTAILQLDGDQDSHAVDASTGQWTGSERVLADGSKQPFEKKAMLKLQVTAEGFEPVKVAYVVRKKNNRIVVELARRE